MRSFTDGCPNRPRRDLVGKKQGLKFFLQNIFNTFVKLTGLI
jgi:hypothetical protein